MKRTEYIISEENKAQVCDDIAAAAERFCTEYLHVRKEILRYRLTVEECVLRWLEGDCIGRTLTFICGKRPLCAPTMTLLFDGAAMNPYIESDSGYGLYGSSVLSTLGLSPVYKYRAHVNVLAFELPYGERSPVTKLLAVIISASLAGILGGLLIPAEVRTLILEGIVNPIYDTFFNILSCIAGPMIFLSVAWGVYGIGDASTLSRIGKNMMLSYVGAVFLTVAGGALLFPVMGLRLTGSGSAASQLSSIMRLVLDIFPSNIVDPFSSGNTLQIILLAFAVGVALLYLGRRTEAVAKAIEQINYLVQFLMGLIGRLVPYFVFIVIVSLFWSDTFGVLSSTWKLLVLIVITFTVTCLTYYIQAAVRNRVSLILLLKKCLPNLLIAISTASSSATFSSSMEICEKRLGVSPTVSGFGVPLAMVMHKPTCALNFLLVSFFFARQYGVECSLIWVLTAVFVSTVLAVATPPIPGGGAAAYTVLFLELGIPTEALALVLALDMLTDFLMTASDMFCLPIVLVNVSGKLGMLDKKILQKK